MTSVSSFVYINILIKRDYRLCTVKHLSTRSETQTNLILLHSNSFRLYGLPKIRTFNVSVSPIVYCLNFVGRLSRILVATEIVKNQLSISCEATPFRQSAVL